MSPSRSDRRRSITRKVLVVLGSLFVGLGTIGVFLPVLPTTPFLLPAAACYMNGSQRFYDWLLSHRWFGRYLRNYREGRGLSTHTKIVSVALIWITMGFSVVFVVPLLPVRIALIAIAVGVSVYLLTRKTYRESDKT